MTKTMMECNSELTANDNLDERVTQALTLPAGMELDKIRQYISNRTQQEATAFTPPPINTGEISPQRMLPIRTS